ncbi:MAG: acetate--CoA ligase family protein [Deltaproteobacteria bacterium]|nr:acetate--CoA ligase family protein [Deltaproteobacteria bacterium]
MIIEAIPARPEPTMSDAHPLDPFFTPRSVAVIGASSRTSSVGYAVFRNLLFGSIAGTRREDGFPGPVHAVNPKGGELLGQPVHRDLASIGAPCDLIVVAIPPAFIPDLIDESARHGVRAAILITAGFSEMGAEGHALQEEVARRARAQGIRLVGPNCLGILRPASGLNASFAAAAPPAGGIGLLSQSGALITGIISLARQEQFGLSAAISLGDKADVADQEMLDFLAADDRTKAIALYVEAARSPRAFFEALRAAAAKKPVVAIKGGATAAGARAATSHTGSLAGSASAYAAAFAQAGVIQAQTVEELISWSRALALQPPAAGDRIAIITNAGGPGVLAADAAFRAGLRLAELSPATHAALDAVLPSVWSRQNPVDIIGDAGPERYAAALDILGAAPEVDGVVLIMTVQAMTDPGATAEAIARAHANPAWTMPIVCSFIGLIGTDLGRYLDERGVPELDTPEPAVRAMAALVARGRFERRTRTAPWDASALPAPDLERAARLVAEAQRAGQRNLDLARARDVLAAAGLRYNESGTAEDGDEAAALAERLGYPVVVKLISPDVLHKSDVGGVVLGVIDSDGVREACDRIRASVARHQPGAVITGFTVEQQVSGTEIIVGTSRDGDFGTLLMVGMGGVFVEVYKDVTFRLAPIVREDAQAMIEGIVAQPLLDGARGRPRLDRGELAEVLMRISDLVTAVPSIEELDVNPLVITERGLVAIDARVIATAASGQ